MNALRKNGFYDFLYSLCAVRFVKQDFGRGKRVTRKKRKQGETGPVFLSFCLSNSKYRDTFTIYHELSPLKFTL